MGTGMRSRGREGVRQGWDRSVPPRVPTPPYPLLGCCFLGILVTFKRLHELDDTDPAQGGLTTALGWTALLARVFCVRPESGSHARLSVLPPTIQDPAISNLPRLGKGCWGSK